MKDMKRIAIIGTGTWGLVLARMLSNFGHKVTVWSVISTEIDGLQKNRQHKNLPNVRIPDEIFFTKEIEYVCKNQDILLLAVPSPYIRSNAQIVSGYIKPGQIIVSVAKGIEP